MTGVQLNLPIAKPPEQAFSLVGAVYDILSDGDWHTVYEMQRIIERRTGEMHSDASLSSRIRDLRKAAYGAHTITGRTRKGLRSWEFRLEA